MQTVDFFTPIVDDAYDYGRIAAANALSDIYAMGGRPITVMNILCFPIGTRDINEMAAILRGGADKIAESGAALVGGHSVDDPEPKYGLAATGLIDPNRVATNAGAKPGDRIVLTKPLGTGIITTAAKFDSCPDETLRLTVESMATLNAGAARAMAKIGIGSEGVHAATDITGFGLAGHLMGMARASGVRIAIESDALPILPHAEMLAGGGNVTKGGKDNLAYLGESLAFTKDISDERRSLIVDPQTSGGLAVCVPESRVDELLAALEAEGIGTRAVIGRVLDGEASIAVQ